MRVSTLPTGHGERVVLRLLDKESARLDLAPLGMDDDDARAHRPADPRAARHRAGHRSDRLGQDDDALRGAVAAGPRGTLNIMTVEDPIEYELDGIGQTQVNPAIELSFARALRTILRQDPDVIMIGEIRDLETAQIAVQATLTGHLVLATLHTNDAASAVTRLVDMGVEPYLLASSLIGVLAQRLVRRLCRACRRRAAPTAGEAQLLAQLGLRRARALYRPQAAPSATTPAIAAAPASTSCSVVDDALRRLIHDGAGEQALRDARARGAACARCAATARAGSRTARPRSRSSCASRATA